MKLLLISFILALLSCQSLDTTDGSDTETDGVGTESTEGETKSNVFNQRVIGPELCQKDSSGSFQAKFDKANSCFEAQDYNKSYFLFKRLLQEQGLTAGQLAAINNNLAIIQLKKGNVSLAESLFRSSLDGNVGNINSFNYQKLMSDNGYLDESDQSYQVVFGMGGSGEVKRLKGTLAYLSGDLASYKDNFRGIYQNSRETHLNYLFGLLKFNIEEFAKEAEEASAQFSSDNVMSKLIELKLRTESGF